MVKLITIFLTSLFTANCLISNLTELNLKFYKNAYGDIGKTGTAVTFFNSVTTGHNIEDTTKETCFKTNITNGKETHEVRCGLWSEKKILIII